MTTHRMLFSEPAIRSGLLRAIGIWLFGLVSLLIAFVLWGIAAVDIGFQRGVEVERERQSRMPVKAPANCTEWLRQCADQALQERFKNIRRRPT